MGECLRTSNAQPTKVVLHPPAQMPYIRANAHSTGSDTASPQTRSTANADPSEQISVTVVMCRRSTRNPVAIAPRTAAKLKSESVMVPEMDGIGKRRAYAKQPTS